mmetsp:Transcript_10711/g.12179  ORF Transcript_10711/g.12179 Transcript_10711/m.12179 type:complete len:181 (+) Transcript_10711:30-572(+)
MKYLLIVALAIMFVSTYAKSDHVYDWASHENSKELYTALRDETDLIFVLFWFKGDDSNEDLKKQNTEIRDKIKGDVLENHPEIVFSEIDLAADGKEDAYKNILVDIMQIDTVKLDNGPIISVINNGEGAWIHGDGTGKEVSESVDIFIHEAKDRKMGGTGYVYGSDKARKDGSVKVGGRR